MSRNIPVAISVSKINVDVGDKNFSVIQIYLQMPIKEFYYYTIKPTHLDGFYEPRDSYGNLIISDSKLREFFQPQAKILSKQIRY